MAHELRPGLKIRFHGGWDGSRERCPVCNFQCGYTFLGEIVEKYEVWDQNKQKYVPFFPEQWTAKLETGAFTTGYPNQFELVETEDVPS